MLAFAPLLAFAALVVAQGPTIATPAAVVQCQPAQISFVATNTPVFISIIPGGQPSAAPLQDLGQQNASPFTWVASIASGTQITFQIRDSTGAVAYSAPVTIQTSSDSSCLGAGASSSASGSASASSAVSSAASASSAASTASVSSSASAEASTSSAVASISSAASSAVASVTSSRATSSAASSTRPPASAASTSASASASAAANAARSNAQVGFAGLLGLVAAVVMA